MVVFDKRRAVEVEERKMVTSCWLLDARYSNKHQNLMKDYIKLLINNLGLIPHPEGGYFKETYRSKGVIKGNALGGEFDGDRNFSTGIYYLLTSNDFSAFHRINQDEMWHFYDGSPLIIHMIAEDGHYSKVEVGNDIVNGQQLQYVVPAGVWFAAKVKEAGSYSLVGCTVAPGFDFKDFDLAKRDELINIYPDYKDIITTFTR